MTITTPSKKNKHGISNEAIIYASILRNVNGQLRQDRGSRLPVKVNVKWGQVDLKKAIYDKFKRYNHVIP